MKQKLKQNKKKLIAALLVLSVVGMMLGCQLTTGTAVEAEVNSTMGRQQTQSDEFTGINDESERMDSNSFTEEGTTTMGTVSQLAQFSLTSALMYVEEMYVEAGSTVEVGDSLFKITEGSMQEALAYYEKRIATAKDSLSEAQLAYEKGVLEATYTKQETLSKAESAAITLENGLNELEENVESKYDKWQEAAYKISAYKDNFYNNLYYTSAGIEEKTVALENAKTQATLAQEEYDAAQSTYTEAQALFEIAMENVNGLVSGTLTETEDFTIESAAADMVLAYEAMESAEIAYDEKRSANEQIRQTVLRAEQELQQANLTWQKNEEQAKASLEQLESSVDALELAYETANMEAEAKRLNLQKEYEACLLESTYAETVYNTTVAQLQQKVETAQNTLDTLLDEQEVLLSLEEGVVVASQSGTLASVSYEAGDVLRSGVAFVTYYDTDAITISVEVEQENIAKLAVGDIVQVTVSENRRGSLEGRIASIASSATTGRSISDVTYAVVVSVDNTGNMLSAGQSATITFKYGE